MSKLKSKLPELHMEYGPLYIPQTGPEAAFRLLTIKEVEGLRIASTYLEDEYVVDAIIERALVYPTVDEYMSAVADQEAPDIISELFELSDLGDIPSISAKINAGRQSIDRWFKAMSILVSQHMNMSIEDVNNLRYDELCELVAAVETQIQKSLDPAAALAHDHRRKKKLPPELMRAIQAHEKISQSNSESRQ